MRTGPEVLAIGVDTYFNSDGSVNPDATLMYASEDAVSFARKSQSNLDADVIGVVADTRDIGVRPTRNNILFRLESIRSAAAVDRPGIFYFSGHGVDNGGVFSICPTDYVREISEQSCISLQHVVDIYSRRYPWSIIVIDACRLSPATGAGATAEFGMPRTGFVLRDNLMVLSACSAGQSAIELARIGSGRGGSIFSHFFWREVEQLRKREEHVNVRSLFENVRDKVSEYVNSRLVGMSQVPVIYGADYDRFYLRLFRR